MKKSDRIGWTVVSLVLLMSLLIAVYTIILQKGYQANTEEAALARYCRK